MLGDFGKAGRAGDVDLGQARTNDVQPHQQQAARRQHRPQGGGNLAFAFGQRHRHALAAHRQVAANLAALRNARQGKRHRLAANDQHPFVALHDFGQVLLHHQGLRAAAVQGFDDAAQVHAVRANPEDAHAAHAVQWLEDDVAVLGVKGFHVGLFTRDQRGADELRKLQDGQLLGVVPQGRRLVEDPGAFALSLAQQVGGVEVLAVKGRVLAHHHGVHAVQRDLSRGLRAEPIIGVACERDFAHRAGHRPTTLPAQLLRLAGHQGVSTPGGLAHHREGGVFVNLERLQRVGHKQQFHACISAAASAARGVTVAQA